MSEFEKWAEDIRRPARSVLIYSRPDLIARLDEIAQSKSTAASCGLDTSDYDVEWEQVATRFSDSALRVTMEHRTMAEIKAVQADCIDSTDEEEQQSRLMADAIISPVISWEQLYALREKIGDMQIVALVELWTTVCFTEVPLAPKDPNA
jgi:hypothetical protein